MSDANLTSIRITGEQSYKVMESNPLFQQIRLTSASLAYEPETTTSNELDSSRQINDLILTGFSSGGDLPSEYIIDNLDPLYESAFFNPWNRVPEVIQGFAWEYGFGTGNVSRITSIAPTTITLAASSVLSGAAKNLTGTEFKAGHLVLLSGMGVVDSVSEVSAATATSLTVAGAPTVASPPQGASVKVVGFVGTAGDIQASITGGNALTSTTLNFTTLGLRPHQWIKIGEGSASAAFGNASLNGYAKIASITANRLSLSVAPSGWVADTGAGKTIRIFFGDTISNGVTSKSFTVEEEFGLNAGTRFLYHRGQQVGTLGLNSDAKSIITQNLTLMGADSLPIVAARTAGATTVRPVLGTPLNSSTAVPLFAENGTKITSPNFVNNFSFSIDNGLRARDAVGVLGAASIGAGRMNMTGTLNTYFGDETYYNKVINNQVTSLATAFRDAEYNKGEVWDMPRVKYSSGAPDVTGIDTDIFVPLNFQALGDPSGIIPHTVMLCRFAYLPA